MRADTAARNEPRGEFAEGYVRIGLGNLESPVVGFLLELGFDGLGLPAVGSPGGLLVTDAVPVEIGPPNVAAFKQAHFVVSPPRILNSGGIRRIVLFQRPA
jgi:hypothetical protein